MSEHPLVEFVPGTGSDQNVKLPVLYIAGYARGPDGSCAFCQGDPCNEDSPPESPIARYFAKASWAGSCPFCEGRPS